MTKVPPLAVMRMSVRRSPIKAVLQGLKTNLDAGAAPDIQRCPMVWQSSKEEGDSTASGFVSGQQKGQGLGAGLHHLQGQQLVGAGAAKIDGCHRLARARRRLHEAEPRIDHQ